MSLEVWHALFPSTMQFLLVCLGVLAGGTIRAFTGFGGGLVLAPLFSLFMPPTDLAVVILLLNFVTSFQTLPGTWKSINWRIVIWISIPSFAGIPVGLFVVEWFDPVLVRRLIGLVVAGVAALMLVGWRYNGPRGALQNTIVGVSSGVLTAIAGVGGPPLVLYLLSDKTLTPAVMRASFLMFFVVAQIATVGYFLAVGSVNPAQMVYTASFLPVYIVSTVLGSWLFTLAMRGRAELFRRISLWLLLGVGIVTMVV